MLHHSTTSPELLALLRTRAQHLLDEVQAFTTFQQSTTTEVSVETRHFRNNVKAEVRSLSRVGAGVRGANGLEDEHEARTLHALHSTNLPFYEAVWEAAKHCRGVQALGQRVYWIPETGGKTVSECLSGQAVQKKSVLVDVVARDGLEWLKVSTINAKRLLFEIAKDGWEKYGDEEVEEEHADTSSKRPDLQIVRLAKDLREASLHVRARYRHPQVRLLLPKIHEGESADIDAILENMRKTGVLVECGRCTKLKRPEPEALAMTANSKFAAMLPHPAEPLTNTINVDCTILLALISDISNFAPLVLSHPHILKNKEQFCHLAILQQVFAEESSPLLPKVLHPLLAGRKLICTTLAAKRACEIVDTMGTQTEKIRASLILGTGDHASMNNEELRDILQQNSVHEVPDNLLIRISQVDFEPDDAFGTDPVRSEHSLFPAKIAQCAVEEMNMSPINRSVFLYGWRENIVTATSNQAVAGRLVRTISGVLNDQERASPNKHDAELRQDFRGPKIWICKTARSLVGKHKGNGKSSGL